MRSPTKSGQWYRIPALLATPPIRKRSRPHPEVHPQTNTIPGSKFTESRLSPTAPPKIHPEARPSHASPWQECGPILLGFLETPFKRVYDELNELQTQYNRLEHITREASVALGGCGPGNILREIAKKADRKELD